MKPRAAVLVVSGAAAVAVAAALAPRAYERIRLEALLRRLEAGPDPEAVAELARPEWAWRVHERFLALGREPGSPARTRLAAPLWEILRRGPIEPRIRRDLFETFCRSEFVAGVKHAVASEPFEPGREDQQHVALAARRGVSRMITAARWCPHQYTVVRPQSGREAVLYMEYFTLGNGEAARLAYRRASWLLFDAGQPPGKDLWVESQDLTEAGALDLFIERVSEDQLPDGRRGLAIQFEDFGDWRQFISPPPGRIPALSYRLWVEGLERSERHLLGRAARSVTGSARGTDGAWFFDEVPVPVEGIPRDRIKVFFRLDPGFAESRGFTALEKDSPPFERTYYLPPAREGESSK